MKIGHTSQPELVKLGLDANHYKTQALSGLGVQEYFMPKTTVEFDHMDPVLRSCFENVDRCRARKAAWSSCCAMAGWLIRALIGSERRAKSGKSSWWIDLSEDRCELGRAAGREAQPL